MVREHFNADWVFALQGWLREGVEKNYRNDLYRWPLLQSFEAEVFQLNEEYRLFVMKDRGPTSAVPAINSITKEWPIGAPIIPSPLDLTKLPVILQELRRYFDTRPQDAVFIVKETAAANLSDDWDMYWSVQDRAAINLQLSQAIYSQLHYVYGFDRYGTFMLPPGYDFLARECERFMADHPAYDRNVFLMTRFSPGNHLADELDAEVRHVLRENGYDPVRADDKMYMPDRNLWNNVCVYMLCSGKGIAILEDRLQDEFNPNVALEYGFMRALNKPTLLLADVGFRNLRADVIGTLRETFDITRISSTIRPAIERWLGDFSA